MGPEGVPVPGGRVLARTRLLTTGEQIDDIACQAGEQVLFHIHAHLTIFGNPRQIPLLAHAQIQLEVGRPLLAPEQITLPPGSVATTLPAILPLAIAARPILRSIPPKIT